MIPVLLCLRVAADPAHKYLYRPTARSTPVACRWVDYDVRVGFEQ